MGMYGIEDLEVSRLHREEIERDIRFNRVSGGRGGGFRVMLELKRDFGLFLRLFQTAKNAG